MKLDIKLDTAAIKWLGELGGNLPKTLGLGVKRTLLEAQRQVGLQMRPGKKGAKGSSDGVLRSRSGSLSRAFTSRGGAIVEIRQGIARADGSLTASHPAARILDEGGTIVPVKAHMLAIPLDEAKTPAGVERWASPREVEGLELRKSKKGHLFLVLTPEAGKQRAAAKIRERSKVKGTGKVPPVGKKDRLLYILKDRVDIKATHYLTRAANATEKLAPAIINNVVLTEIVNRKGIA